MVGILPVTVFGKLWWRRALQDGLKPGIMGKLERITGHASASSLTQSLRFKGTPILPER
jgi:hypothetical protein